ncbi:MAG: hypothetical protein U0529_14440 [Thermoanaerobaculia bacterium]
MHHTRLLALLPFSFLVACAQPVPQQQPSHPAPSVPTDAPVKWPPLPTSGFVSGRAATSEDAAAGRAAFSAQAGDAVIGKPLALTVPQYAYHIDESGKRTPGILIQAEEVRGVRMVGFQPLGRDDFLAVLESEVELLGTMVPAAPAPRNP